MEIRKVDVIKQELIELLAKVHNPNLVNEGSHVHQIWSDGEFTLQKAGPLFGLRNLHCMVQSLNFENIPYFVPSKNLFPVISGDNAYAFVTKEDGVLVGNLIKEYVISNVFYYHNY